jgi:tetratricopeptide (TPR) repeat protein
MMCVADGMAGQYYTEALAFKHCDCFQPHLETILQEGATTLREFALKGEYIDAASILADIGEYAPDRREAFKKVIRDSGLSDEPENIEKVMQTRIEADPGNSEDWFWLGNARLKQKDYSGAEGAFEKAVELKPDDPDAWRLLGMAQGDQQDYAGAEVALQKAIELKPNKVDYRNCYAYILFRSHRFKEAIEAQYQILKMDRFYAEAYFDLCLFNLLTGSVDTLCATMEKALRTKKAPSGFKTQIQLFFALVLAHDGEKKAFLKNLGPGVRALETIDEKLRRKILSDLSRFLVDAISPMTLESVKTYVDEFQKATEDTAVLSIIRPLNHVLEYTQACITQKTGYASKQAQNALDRVPGELKGPVGEMADKVRKNLKWQSKVLKR